MIFLVDMDGPLADFEGEFLKRWREKYPDLPFINIEERTTFKLKDQYPLELQEKVRGIYEEHGFVEELPAVKGVVNFINEATSLGHSIFICTAPLSSYNPNVLEKYKWVEKNIDRDFVKRIITTKDKTLIKGDFIIDDNPKIEGLKKPEWKQVIFDAPYNREADLPRIKSDWSNWKEILL